ncbi:MAG: DUF2062 domain-containing protein [Opitutaceae bacterium]|nr:DUF2062 domain-containing protein [Opitutaceae bacterium]
MSSAPVARLVRGGTDVTLVSAPPPSSASSSSAPAPRPGFWQRRVVGPIRAQLTQGVTPDKLALTLGLGTACSLLPFLGLTSLLNLGVGLALRMNQPILQTLNQLLGPVQLVLILVHVRIGEWLWRAEGDRFTVGEMMRVFRDSPIAEFFARFGWAGIHALSAWLLLAPVLAAVVYFSVRPALRRAAAAIKS